MRSSVSYIVYRIEILSSFGEMRNVECRTRNEEIRGLTVFSHIQGIDRPMRADRNRIFRRGIELVVLSYDSLEPTGRCARKNPAHGEIADAGSI